MKENNSFFKRALFLFVAVAVVSSMAWAQKKTINGVVKDATGEPIIGASVVVVGTTLGTVTDLNGVFHIEVPTTAKNFEISYLGMEKKIVAITGTEIIVTLKDESKGLDELVVVGYGVVKKRDLTGAVASVSGKDLVANPVSDVKQALQGHLPGVSVTSQDGRPGAAVAIRVRGGGSISQSNDPIFIVDGFPVSDISDIPADRIESIDVLKDASSTAIYGARGANGVILVTTKGATSEKTTVTYSNYIQSKVVAKTLDVVENAQDYVAYTWAYAGLLGSSYATIGTTFFGLGSDANAASNWATYGTMKTHNYTNDLLRSAISHNHNLSISGGSEKTKYLFEASYLDDEGIRINSGYDRWNASLKISHQLAKKMSLNLNFSYVQTTTNGKNDMGNLATAYQYRAIEPLGDGSDYSGWGNGDANVDLSKNVVDIINNITQINKSKNINGQSIFKWELIKGLTLNDELGLNTGWSENKYWDNGYTAYKYAKLNQYDWWGMRNAVTLNYQVPGLGKDNNLNFLAGQEVVMSNSNGTWIYGAGYPDTFGFDEAFGMITMTDTSLGKDERGHSIGTPSRTQSWFGRANYTLLDRYLLTATFRADGSTKFAPNNRWGYFPAAALGWRVSDEPFMVNAKTWLDNLKLRVSYGESGADNISSSLWKDTWTTGTASVNGTTVTTYVPGSLLPNPDLKWETTISRNIGIDFGVLNSRLTGTLELYRNTNKDLLLRVPVDATTGYSYQYQNIGITSNKGIELSLNVAIVKTKNFNLKASVNYNYNDNRIDKLADGMTTTYGQIYGSTGKLPTYEYQLIEGRPVGTLLSYQNLGYYSLDDFDYDSNTKTYTLKDGVADLPLSITYPGRSKFTLASGQKAFPGCLKIATDTDGTAAVKKYDMIAKHSGGFSFNGNYKSIDFSANFTYQIGGNIYNAQAMNDYYGNKDVSLGANHYAYFNNTYKMWEVSDGQLTYYTDPDNLERLNTNASYALPTFENAIMLDNWIEDASYLRLSTLTIGYTFPKSITKKIAIENARIYTTGTNLFCLTGYSGLDPEVDSITSNSNFPTPGVDFSSYPRARTFTLGLSVTF